MRHSRGCVAANTCRKRAHGDIRGCLNAESDSGFSDRGTRGACNKLDNYYNDAGFSFGLNENVRNAVEEIMCGEGQLQGVVEVTAQGRISGDKGCGGGRSKSDTRLAFFGIVNCPVQTSEAARKLRQVEGMEEDDETVCPIGDASCIALEDDTCADIDDPLCSDD